MPIGGAASEPRTRRPLLFGVALAALLAAGPGLAGDFKPGDVFAAIGNGQYRRFAGDGTPLETLDTGVPGYTTGCAFAHAGEMSALVNGANTIVVLDRVHPHPILRSFATTGLTPPSDDKNEAVVFDRNGDFYVTHAGGGHDIHKYTGGGVLADEYAVASDRYTDWVDLSMDQCTLFYTAETRTVFRFDVCRRAQLPDFAALPGTFPAGAAYALRLLPPGDGSGGLLVADRGEIKRLDAAGRVIQVYDLPGEDYWFALNLDPDGTSFWSGGTTSSAFYRFDIATGQLRLGPIATGGASLTFFGLCVYGEPTAGECVVASPPPVTRLRGVRRGDDVDLDWDPATDPITDHHNVWKVVNGDKLLIPLANRVEAALNPSVQAACLGVPAAQPACSEVAVVAAPPPLLFYQVRGACASGLEGPQ